MFTVLWHYCNLYGNTTMLKCFKWDNNLKAEICDQHKLLSPNAPWLFFFFDWQCLDMVWNSASSAAALKTAVGSVVELALLVADGQLRVRFQYFITPLPIMTKRWPVQTFLMCLWLSLRMGLLWSDLQDITQIRPIPCKSELLAVVSLCYTEWLYCVYIFFLNIRYALCLIHRCLLYQRIKTSL